MEKNDFCDETKECSFGFEMLIDLFAISFIDGAAWPVIKSMIEVLPAPI